MINSSQFAIKNHEDFLYYKKNTTTFTISFNNNQEKISVISDEKCKNDDFISYN